MRLTHIRLAGFKSFVEPTSFAVPSHLVGVVGPNGCGKSNIIDAVRWVLGESKAAELRGESMQDVIFNGSTHRKPASRASVELVFDNTQGRAGGSWNQYAEISVKRVLARDGASTYYINQQAVRRRDVQDIFMGTGLGPRAYAIIGQGMIARLIEARPEELRVFLEEAAGVSRYKERRRETGNRLSDTRDNLTRVEDILRELTGQIERLEQQAIVARQYREYDAEKTTRQRWLWMIRLLEAREQKNACSARMERAKADLERLQAHSVHTQTELLLLRNQQIEAQHVLDTNQTHWIEANRQVSRLEADLRVMAESRHRLNARKAELEQEIEIWRAREATAQTHLEQVQDNAQSLRIHQEEAAAALEVLEDNKEPLEQQQEQSRQHIEKTRAITQELQREQSQMTSRQEAAHRALTTLKVRQDRLQNEKAQVQTPSEEALTDAQTQLDTLQAEVTRIQNDQQIQETEWAHLNAQLEQSQQLFLQERDRHANAQARLLALQQLNEELADRSELTPWLKEQGLTDTPRILERLQVERGWEKALESALREHLDSFVLDQLDSILSLEKAGAPPTSLAFLESSAAATTRAPSTDDLASMLTCPDATLTKVLHQLLDGAQVAADLNTAFNRRKQLKTGQRIYTPGGHCVTSNGVIFYAPQAEQSGRLERKQQIDALDKEVRALDMLRGESQSKYERLQAQVSDARLRFEATRTQADKQVRLLHDAQLQQVRLTEAAQRAQSRLAQLDDDLAAIDAEQQEHQALLLENEDAQAELEERLALAVQHFETARDTHHRNEQQLRDYQLQIQAARQKAQEASFAIRNEEVRQRELEREIRYAQEQAAQLNVRQTHTQQELDGLSEIQIQADLQQALEERVIAEEQVSVAREALEQWIGRISELEQQEKDSDRQTQPLRDSIQDLALKMQAADLTIEQYSNQLAEVQADEQQLSAELAALEIQPKASSLQADVTRFTAAIQALGAVNLAALDELAAASDRKIFLDSQAKDLIQAMDTLEDAIRKIDMETRELLSETFNLVNSHFSRLFPLLFGGGEARLVMTGDEILDAGVQVFAQPPGKKNGTIHLLSGGEKALTATALVFAIFELNPAPFCLLDEVDAPLDDANTERFAKLVKQMSEQTQFLFISHNKIAMEMAEQLIGVTMQEKGVSRIVAVDLASAEKMALETV